jgi:hypothetical protein
MAVHQVLKDEMQSHLLAGFDYAAEKLYSALKHFRQIFEEKPLS